MNRYRKIAINAAVFLSLFAATMLVTGLFRMFVYGEAGVTLTLTFVIILYAALITPLLTRPRRSGLSARRRETR